MTWAPATQQRVTVGQGLDTSDSSGVKWRSLEGPPHRVVRKHADNNTGVTVNHENLWESSLIIFFTIRNIIGATFFKIVPFHLFVKSWLLPCPL